MLGDLGIRNRIVAHEFYKLQLRKPHETTNMLKVNR